MYICYIDESGTSDIPGNTSHFILAGISIPVWHWRGCDREIEKIKNNYGLGGSEIHVGWMLRPYTEQIKIDGFELLHYPQRRSKVLHQRKIDILQIQRKNKPLLLKQTKKNYRKTDAYIHLTRTSRCHKGSSRVQIDYISKRAAGAGLMLATTKTYTSQRGCERGPALEGAGYSSLANGTASTSPWFKAA